MIHCNCTTDCSTARCSCQKHGLPCSLACGQCRGSDCQNASPYIEDDENEEKQDKGVKHKATEEEELERIKKLVPGVMQESMKEQIKKVRSEKMEECNEIMKNYHLFLTSYL